MYDSPITLMVQKITEQVAKELDEATFKAVELVMPTVNREELIRALKYDREQYDKGYADGKRDAMDELVRCKDCKWFAECVGKDSGKPCGYGQCTRPLCMRRLIGTDDFCSCGERKEAEDDD